MSASSTDAEALWSFGASHCAVGSEPSGSRRRAVMNQATRSSVIFGSVERAPRPSVVNHFRSEEAGDRVGERVVIEIATTPRRTKGSGAQFFPVKVRNLIPVMTALPESALRVAEHVGVTDLSALLRGAILAVDALLTSPAAREAMVHDLRLLALGSGA